MVVAGFFVVVSFGFDACVDVNFFVVVCFLVVDFDFVYVTEFVVVAFVVDSFVVVSVFVVGFVVLTVVVVVVVVAVVVVAVVVCSFSRAEKPTTAITIKDATISDNKITNTFLITILLK